MMHSTQSEADSFDSTTPKAQEARDSSSSGVSTIDTTWEEDAPELEERHCLGCYIRVNFPLPSQKGFKDRSISFVNMEVETGDFAQLSVSDLKQLVFAALIQNMEFMHVKEQTEEKHRTLRKQQAESTKSNGGGATEGNQNGGLLVGEELTEEYRPPNKGWFETLWGNGGSGETPPERQEGVEYVQRKTTNQANSMIGEAVHLYSDARSFAVNNIGKAPSSVSFKNVMPGGGKGPIMIKLPHLHQLIAKQRGVSQERSWECSVDKDGLTTLHSLHGPGGAPGLAGMHEDATGRMAYIHDPKRMREALLKGPDQFVFKLGQETDTDPSMRWLTDEDESLAMIAQALDNFDRDKILELWLISQHKAPIPRIFCSINGNERAVDAFSKPFTQYFISVRYERMEWRVHRRYTEFLALHKKLTAMTPGSSGYISKRKMPNFPHKQMLLQITFQKTDHHQRQRELEAYLVQLTALPESNENIEILGFLGVISTRQEEINSMRADRARPKLLVHLNALAQNNHLEWGDVLMFKCNNAVSRIQRRLTGAEWDHTAIIVQDKMGGPLLMLEATGDGVRRFPVVQRIRAYGNEFTQYIALRKLKARKTMAMYEKMLEFVQKVVGKPYGFSLGRLLNRAQEKVPDSDSEVGSDRSPRPNRYQGTGESYFCSELVAACLQYMGIIGTERNCSSFWPGSFASGGDIDDECEENFSFSDEIIIDCHTLEIGNAKH